MSRALPLVVLFLSLLAAGSVSADWWSDNGDSASSEDIDADAKPETSANDDLVRDAQGPGQPQNNGQSQAPMIYDAWGRPYVYGMPYGYGAGFGYGMGYMAGPYPRGAVGIRR
ncbi:MAG: hypothetical protein RLZ25_1441 [Pseudomonadota bacterium]|jgi:hypothetical protein